MLLRVFKILLVVFPAMAKASPDPRQYTVQKVGHGYIYDLHNADTTANPQADTLRWNATGFTDLTTNQSTDKACQFVTYGKDKIDWIQKNGSLVYSFTVDSTTDGGWVDANADGSITYNVRLDHMSGTLTIARNAGAISVVLKLAGGADKISLQYDITDFDIL